MPQVIDYDRVWAQWGDMSDNAPTPIHTRRLIVREAKKLEFSSVLDIGCGNGILISTMQKNFPGRSFNGADISRTALERCIRRWPGIPFHAFDIQSESLDKKFDLILLSEVIEHVQEPGRAMANIRKMCSGYLILTTPTGPRLPTDLAFHHLKHFTPEELSRLVSEAGFKVVRRYLWGWPFQVLFRYLINLAPQMTHKSFVSGGNYGIFKKVVSKIWTWLFYCNISGKGTQQVLVAKVN
ncbi:MAG: hypothetical protein A3J74_07025 [Elusimicrobia bacterium RIFCSPHIGHO2_02_FULL_57_9]|nr:MAG: hypothetical protein A3J74_07025 [Elusimicrobia bacterium RIFCSPHIGHO2_02_FULL_57_9]